MNEYTFDDMKNKVCVITGGSGTIGSTLAKGLAKVGVNLVILSRNKNKAEKVVEEIKEISDVNTISVTADVTDKVSLVEAKHTIVESFGKIDYLINCTGGNSPDATTQKEIIPESGYTLEETFFGLEMEGFKNVFDLNLIGTVLPTMIFTEEMIQRKTGAILNVSSMSAFHPLTKIPAYSAAKSAVNNFTQWLAVHLAKTNVRVNAIAPGFFLTEQNRFLLLDEKTNQLTERGKKIINMTPMNKFGNAEDLIGATLFLLSDLSNFITGTVLPVDGGFNAYSGV